MNLPAAFRGTLRRLGRRPSFSIAVVATLGLGIGAATGVFSVVRSLLLRPLEYREPEQLVAIAPNLFVGNQELELLRARARSYQMVAAFSPGWLMALTDVATPRQLNAARVSGNLFAMLGVEASLGRAFGPEADVPGNDMVAVLSDRTWRADFGADPAIVGRSIRLNDARYTVVAVMPPGYQMFDTGTDLWYPLPLDRTAMTWSGSSVLYGRLTRSGTIASASSELASLVPALRDLRQRPANWGLGVLVVGLQDSIVGGLRPMLVVLAAGVVGLLLIAIANVAGLFTLRTAERGRELAVRSSLGASRGQLALLLMAESLVVSAVGGAIGVALGVGGVGLLRRILPADLPRLSELSVDGWVLGFAASVTILATLLFGLGPTLGRGRPDLATSLRQGRGSIGGERTRGILVAAEVALALILTVGTGLMIRTLASLIRVDPGLRADHLLTMRLQPAGLSDPVGYWRQVLETVRATPGVKSAGTILHLPTSGRSWSTDIEVAGQPLAPGATPPRSAWQSISAGYFATAGVPILQGRDFGPADGNGAPLVMVINSALAARLFPGQSPIGQRIKAGYPTSQSWATVIGVVGGVRHDSLNVPPAPELYVPFEQRVVGANSLVIRTVPVPETMTETLEKRIWSIDRAVPISEVHSMDALFSASLARPRLILLLLAAFATIGVTLGAVGVYGIAASWARQRDREIAIRVALGAEARSVAGLVLRQGLRYAGAGLAIGIPIAAVLARAMRGLLYGVGPADPGTFAAVALVLSVVAAGATWAPARRAARTDPTATLRE